MQSNPPRSILVVDSDPHIVDMLKIIFSEMGLVPHGACSVTDALAACAAQGPDLALIDIDVPNWIDLLAALRGRNPLVRCYLVGAAGSRAYTMEDLGLLGVTCFFAKPFTLQQLKADFDS